MERGILHSPRKLAQVLLDKIARGYGQSPHAKENYWKLICRDTQR